MAEENHARSIVEVGVHVVAGQETPVRWRTERWVPNTDDGSTFTPGHWEQTGEGVVDVDWIQSYSMQPGESVSIWRE